MTRPRTTTHSATRAAPCAVCGAVDGCTRGDDGLIFCRKSSGDAFGFVRLGESTRDPQYHLYRREGDPVLEENHRPNSTSRRKGPTPQASASPAWSAKAKRFAEDLTPPLRAELADALGLPEAVLASVGVGWCAAEECWTFPEADGCGRVVGVNRRFRNGDKKAMAGCQRGLTIAEGWRERPGPVFCPEGASNTLALTALGLAAVGRPSNRAGVEQLAGLLGLESGRDIIIIGDIDAKSNGDWPGKEGAVATADKLAELLGRPVSWTLPPDNVKDVRAWLLGQKADPDRWPELGWSLHAQLLKTSREGRAEPPKQGLATTTLKDILPQPVHWLVPRRIPRGKLILVAGDGGNGKSTLTLHLAACISRGKPALGLEYPAAAAGDVLIASCEDDFADTVVPRLLAAGADLSRIHRIDGVNSSGEPLPFSLAHYEQLEQELKARPNVRLVIVDPAGAYIGRSGVDDHKDSELRALLGPLSDLAAKYGVTIILIKHLNKGVTAKAVHKVSGSAGYVNAVRAAFVVSPADDDPEKKLLLPLKFNIGPRPSGLAYRLQSLPEPECERILAPMTHLGAEDLERLKEQLFGIQWEGEVDISADDALGQAARNGRGPTKVARCVEWLRAFLGEFSWPDKEVLQAAEGQGFTFDNYRDAKRQLKPSGLNSKPDGKAGPWWLGFGDPLTMKRRPDTPHTPKTPETPQTPDTYAPSKSGECGESRESVECGESCAEDPFRGTP
jgi:hypothetical protein